MLGSEHLDTLASMNNLAVMLDNQGKHKEAESMHQQTLAPRDKIQGPKYLNKLTSMNNLS
jgi:hypothetical protein